MLAMRRESEQIYNNNNSNYNINLYISNNNNVIVNPTATTTTATTTTTTSSTGITNTNNHNNNNNNNNNNLLTTNSLSLQQSANQDLHHHHHLHHPHHYYSTLSYPSGSNIGYNSTGLSGHQLIGSRQQGTITGSNLPTTSSVGLDEYVDILQVQQLLLDSNSTTITTNSTSTVPCASISPGSSNRQRPKVNLQKAGEYSCQVQADSPSRRVLLDYPSPYLYGNYHTSPSEDLVALWFGGNGTVGIKTCPHYKVLAPLSLPPNEHHNIVPSNYNYDPSSSIGPDAWGVLAIDCIGYNQSPINIDFSKACCIKPHASDGLKLFRWDEVPQKIILVNAGVTIKLFFEYKLNAVPTLCGGPVKTIYELSNLHVHWAGNSYEGSEHYLDGKSSSAEVHALFKNKKYKTEEKALEHRDGFCVVARLYDYVSNQKHYLPFISKLKRITKFNQSYTFKEPYTFTLSCIMGSVGFEYFVYQGSLTTPPCSEAVTWIVIMETKKISIADLEELRKLRNSKNGWMTPNIRRIQPLNERSLFHYTR